MTTTQVYYYLDVRATLKDGSHPLTLTIYHHGQRNTIRTGISLTNDQWSKTACAVTKAHRQHKALNAVLTARMYEVEQCVTRMKLDGSLTTTTPQGLKQRIACIFTGQDSPSKPMLIDVYRQFTDTHQHDRTRAVHLATERKLKSFCPAIADVGLDDVDVAWLERFDAFLSSTKSINARSIDLRNLRAAYNWAIDHELTEHYPFRRFHIKSEPTRHRALPVEQLRELLTIPVLDYEEVWRDWFALSFFLCGISPVDLAHLPPMKHGRILYRI